PVRVDARALGNAPANAGAIRDTGFMCEKEPVVLVPDASEYLQRRIHLVKCAKARELECFGMVAFREIDVGAIEFDGPSERSRLLRNVSADLVRVRAPGCDAGGVGVGPQTALPQL